MPWPPICHFLSLCTILVIPQKNMLMRWARLGLFRPFLALLGSDTHPEFTQVTVLHKIWCLLHIEERQNSTNLDLWEITKQALKSTLGSLYSQNKHAGKVHLGHSTFISASQKKKKLDFILTSPKRSAVMMFPSVFQSVVPSVAPEKSQYSASSIKFKCYLRWASGTGSYRHPNSFFFLS